MLDFLQNSYRLKIFIGIYRILLFQSFVLKGHIGKVPIKFLHQSFFQGSYIFLKKKIAIMIPDMASLLLTMPYECSRGGPMTWSLSIQHFQRPKKN